VTDSALRRVLMSCVVLGLLAIVPSAAMATVVPVTSVTFPSAVTVGQTGALGSLRIEQHSTGAESFLVHTVCNPGDPGPPCASPEAGIALVPACKRLAANVCTPAGADPGVVAVSPTATGRAGSACASMTFTTGVADPTFGTVVFLPNSGAHVMLPANTSPSAACIIDFTFSLLKAPTGDADASVPGTQLGQATQDTQVADPFVAGSPSATGYGSAFSTTVLRAGPPAIATTASPAATTIGGQLTDTATVTGLVAPVAGSTVTFRLYPPSDPTCVGGAIFTSTKIVTLSGSTATATSDAFTTTTAGVHHWVATFDGDGANLPSAGTCGQAGESATVNAIPPQPPPPVVLPPSPAKLEVLAAKVAVAARRLQVLAPISSRASGDVDVEFLAAGRTTRFTAAVDARHARVRIDHTLPAAQARLGTGILTLSYPGDADTQPQKVRLRAASRPARLVAGRPTIAGGMLRASGKVSTLARGVVRVQLLFEPPDQGTFTAEFNAPIKNGRYSLNQRLTSAVLAGIAARRGVVHSYTLFTGYAAAHMRGEMASFQVLGTR
jgi:hypothetical protein